MFSVILGSSYHVDVCSSAHLSDKFCFNQLFEFIKTSCAQLLIGSDGCEGRNSRARHRPQSLLRRLWLPMTSKSQNSSAHIQDILAYFCTVGGSGDTSPIFYTEEPNTGSRDGTSNYLKVGCNLQPHCQTPLNPTHWIKWAWCLNFDPMDNSVVLLGDKLEALYNKQSLQRNLNIWEEVSLTLWR